MTQAWAGQLEGEDLRVVEGKVGGGDGRGEVMAREAFSGGSDGYSVSVEGGKLVWRKVGGKARLKLMEVDLTPLNFEDAQKDIFDNLLEANKRLSSKNEEYSKRQEKLVTDLKKSRIMLVDFEKTKNELEDKFYESFLPILNSKKEKIVELERRLESGGRVEEKEEESDGYGGDTDVEEEEEERGEKRKIGTGEEGNRSSRIKVQNMDDSLDLLNDDF